MSFKMCAILRTLSGPILPKEKISPSVQIGTLCQPTIYASGKKTGFIQPNEVSEKPLASFVVTVDAIEKETGLNFFSGIPKEEQEKLEKRISVF